MAGSFKARDGKTIKNGDEGTFQLAKGVYARVHEQQGMGLVGEPVIVEVTGTIRHFDQIDRVYDEEHIAVGKRTEEHWEIVTDDPNYPAVGVRPENVLALVK